MSERQPKLSIGMPVYNAERYIVEALDSLLAQTFHDFELIVSDNCSTDGTEEICRDYARRDARIRYVRQPQNRGAIWNFNHVFSLATGGYFKWSSYDDFCEPTFLERCVNVLDARPDVAWCHTQSGKIDGQGDLLTVDPDAHEGFAGWVHTTQAGLPRKNFDSPRASQRFLGVLLGTDWCVDSYGVIRADALRRTCMLPNCYGAEKVLMADLSLQGTYHEIPETLFYQRIHARASGAQGSAAAQQWFADPSKSTRFAGTRLKLLTGYMRAIRNANIAWRERWRCYAALVAYVCQFRKWSRVLRTTLSGTGIKCHQNTDAQGQHKPQPQTTTNDYTSQRATTT